MIYLFLTVAKPVSNLKITYLVKRLETPLHSDALQQLVFEKLIQIQKADSGWEFVEWSVDSASGSPPNVHNELNVRITGKGRISGN